MAGERALRRGAGGAGGVVPRAVRDSTCCSSSTPTCSRTGRARTSPTTCGAIPADVGAELVAVSRGGDITYHGPGQLVGYPILTVANKLDAAGHVRNVEQVVIDTLAAFGVSAGRLPEYPGVWVDAAGPNPRKICAIGVRLKAGRTMHGFALNVATDMAYLREHIVACGIGDRPVTSLREEGVDVEMRDVVDVLARIAGERWGHGRMERQDVAWRHRPEDLSLFSRGAGPGDAVRPDRHAEPVRLTSRLAEAGVADGLSISTRKPDWLRPKVHHTAAVLDLKRTIRSLGLVTVCEDAGCPNLSECWADGTATFMVLGDRCTRACGFCLVDTRKPEAPAADEPATGRRGDRPHGARSRRADDGGSRRPRRRRDGPRRRVRRGDPRTASAGAGRDA